MTMIDPSLSAPQPAASPKGFGQAMKSAFRQPAFIVAFIVLLIAAVGLNTSVQKLQLFFKKEPVPLVRQLDAMPEKLGHWLQVSKDEPLDKEVQDTLGTEKFIFRNYIDVNKFTKAEIDEFKDKSFKERGQLLGKLQQKRPDGVMNLAVTYYTGLVDTVAHIPDRCYIADGYQPTEYTQPYWDVKNQNATQDKLQVRFINFEDQSGSSRTRRNVAYFFHVNGKYESDPLDVRANLQNLFRKHGYYAKVELMNVVRDSNESAAMMTDFLRDALPEIEKSLPDWEKIEGKK